MKRAVFAIIAAACHAHAPPPIPTAATATLALDDAEQVVDQGDLTYIFTRTKLVIARGGLALVSVPAPPCPSPCTRLWTSAASIAALDGEGRWAVATRVDGTLWWFRADGELEPIGDRFGLGDTKIGAIAAAGSTIALGLANGTAITTDGKHLARYPTAGPLAVARDRVAIATAHAIEVWDLAQGTSRSLPLTGTPMFVDADSAAPRLVVQTPGGLWIERAGTLHTIDRSTVQQVVVAGARLWAIRAPRSLSLLVGDALVPAVTDLRGTGELHGATNGDLWIAATDLRRYGVARGDDGRWQREIAPVFQRVCSHCHLPGGDADLDLSTASAWRAEHDEIIQRVIVDRTMPPAGTDLGDADRATLATYLGVKP